MTLFKSFSAVLILISSAFSFADPVVGRDAAAGYMGKEPQRSQEPTFSGPREHYLALHVGSLLNAESWKWGTGGKKKDVGAATIGVTYKIKEWHELSDLAIRMDFNEYDIGGKRPQKLSFLPMILFPEAASQFPLYFGAGVGVGVFFKQLSAESSLSLDYQMIVGARFFDVFENTGFFIESGLKNHIQLTDEGQVNSSFVALGALFTF